MEASLGLRPLDASAVQNMAPTALPSVNTGQSDADLRDAALQFESLFVKQMLKASRATLNPEDNMMYGGQAEQIFTDMLDDEYADLMSRIENFGLAEMLYEQLSGRNWNQGLPQA